MIHSCATSPWPALPSGFEQFNRIAIGILDLDLAAAGPVSISRWLLVLHCEPEPLRIERDGAGDGFHMVSDAVDALDERVFCAYD